MVNINGRRVPIKEAIKAFLLLDLGESYRDFVNYVKNK